MPQFVGASVSLRSFVKESQAFERAYIGGDHEPTEPSGAAMNVYSESTITFFLKTIRYRRFLQ